MRYLKYILAVLVVALSVPSIHAKKKVKKMTEEKLLERLLEEFPNCEIKNITKSWLYYDVKKIADKVIKIGFFILRKTSYRGDD